MQVQSLEVTTGKSSEIEIADGVFGVPYNEALLHQVVVAQMAGMRSANAVQKNRAAVRGGGRKPWKQKGTGRARAGSIRSPIWRGGGRAFPGGNENYTQKVNKKMWAGAMRTVLAELLRQGRLQIIQQEDFGEPRSRLGRDWLSRAGGDDVLLVMGEVPLNLFLGLRNFPRVGIAGWQDVGPADLLQYGRVLLDVEAAARLGEVYG
ncbi:MULTISPECIES: 50S ribosomal protein L4 [Acidithiobacillus]|jgi:large subunit ribosomal protein L4|uniref:Large ribosomal subunit protein uL4 n=2 Tax=Acidithiobacillus ferridurans TaxID=1232575 RepID=A0A2Z6IHF7_ACIFI|nr:MULTISPECIES: 50S ribosomal protein L4 [Acidithiobacillus]MBU2715439.1 50S ribosomal protein L4 [Acidithiobacillus ferridurans]MBU2718580.1 50S ribosomal protein L4 [Acidithiobacillus ferridurans]MBU2722289.1 50S ribosomal protein L4 [Acidithiobacillus ferridurans]MBU2727578.1 50S ribosomal protein L4 [Acidithiobacillus ferridurans]MBU2731524.1 50S ribosomal protein L4 [Acidithiobacillus ferridurans]